jgi:hypothetical protein
VFVRGWFSATAKMIVASILSVANENRPRSHAHPHRQQFEGEDEDDHEDEMGRLPSRHLSAKLPHR